MNFNPQFIDNISAFVFWNYVDQTSFGFVVGEVQNGQWNQLWKKIDLYKLMIQAGTEIPRSEFYGIEMKLKEEIRNYLTEKTHHEARVMGSTYMDDTKTGISEEFNKYDELEKLQDMEEHIVQHDFLSKGLLPPETGELLLRAPLPACVYSMDKVETGIIKVRNVEKALGFRKNLFLVIDTKLDLPENPWRFKQILSGVFHIPGTNETEALWHKLIPNGLVLLQGIEYFQ